MIIYKYNISIIIISFYVINLKYELYIYFEIINLYPFNFFAI